MIEENFDTEIDLDAWLAGGERNSTIVHLYMASKTLERVREIEKELSLIPDEPEEQSLGSKPKALALNEELEELLIALDKSKKTFRVEALTQLEKNEIITETRKELSDELDEAAARGRAYGKQTAERMGIKDPKEINQVIRTSAQAEVTILLEHEAGCRMIARATKTRKGEDWAPLTLDQIKRMYEVIGEQVQVLNNALSIASTEVPRVTVKK